MNPLVEKLLSVVLDAAVEVIQDERDRHHRRVARRKADEERAGRPRLPIPAAPFLQLEKPDDTLPRVSARPEPESVA